MPFKQHKCADLRRRSAEILVKELLQMKGLYPAHRRQFLKNALWKLTQADGIHKHETRFQSAAARQVPRKLRRHDHVFQRAIMVDDLEKARPDQVDAILKRAVACAVTEEEHRRLDAFKELDGWQRYHAAGIIVIDTATEKPVDLKVIVGIQA